MAMTHISAHGSTIFGQLPGILAPGRWSSDARRGRQGGFTILDSDDQLRIIKRISKELGFDESVWPSQ